MRKQVLSMQKQVEQLEAEKQQLQQRLEDLAALKDRPDLEEYMRKHNVRISKGRTVAAVWLQGFELWF